MKRKSYNDLSKQCKMICQKIYEIYDNTGVWNHQRENIARGILNGYSRNIGEYFGTAYDSPKEKKYRERNIKLPRQIYAGY